MISPTKTYDVSIIIVNYNTVDLTRKCVNLVIQHTKGVQYEILIVDNASTDGSAESFKKNLPSCRLIELSENVGFGAANNIGMSCAKGETFLLMNSDVLLQSDAISYTFNKLTSLPSSIGVLGCRLMNEDGSVQESVFHGEKAHFKFWTLFLHSLKESVIFRAPNYLFGRDVKYVPVDHVEGFVTGVSGAYMHLRKEVFELTGGFDPDFFMYCEETEWQRNRLAGTFQVYYDPAVSVVHLGGKSSAWGHFQNYLSYFLYIYKINRTTFWLYLFGESLIAVTELPFYVLTNKIRSIRNRFRCILKAAISIPRYSSAFAARGSDRFKFTN